jgi:ligand-binding sensor domain-containing protein
MFRMIRFYKYFPAFFIIMLVFNGLDEIQAQNGHDFVFDRITSENIILQKGLSQNTIYCMMEDRQGYMWFGTWDGLNKYDGYNFTIYNKQNGLSNETINTILEDELGRIWIGTENGLNCLHRKTGEITVYKSVPGDSTTLSGNWINHL